MNANELLLQTRRHFFADGGLSLGAAALLGLMDGKADLPATPTGAHPFAPRPTHFPARAKRVIYLFMAGGPSQLELFDHKPQLRQPEGQPFPPSFLGNRRFAFIPNDAKLLGTRRRFPPRRRG